MKSKIFILAALAAASTASMAKISDGKSYGAWEGVCEKNECAVLQVVNNKEKTPVGRVILRKLAEEKNMFAMIITVPLGVNLRAGLGLAIDGEEIGRVPFDLCNPGGCTAALPVKDDLLQKIKKGKALQVAAFVDDKQQTLPFSLSGATKAIEAL